MAMLSTILLGVGIIDADHFKQINYTYLQTGGDATLIGLTKLLTAMMRESDSVGRVGGEEFLVIVRETNEEGARLLAETRILALRSQSTPIEYHDQLVQITVSIGFAVAEGETPSTYALMYEEASAALKDAKDQGRNRCVIRRMKTERWFPFLRPNLVWERTPENLPPLIQSSTLRVTRNERQQIEACNVFER